MLYVEYQEYKTKYYKAQKEYDKVLSEKETLFNRTQPKGTTYDKEKVSGGMVIGNVFDTYLISKETKRIEERLEEARSILKDREKLLKLKEEELRESKDWHDIIYTYYYLEKLSIRKIERRIPYSKTQIYRILETIRENIKEGTKWEKSSGKMLS
jgi:hypothetical protein